MKKNYKNYLKNKIDPNIFALEVWYLGGNIMPSKEIVFNLNRNYYIDLEEFFLNATNHVFNDTRLTRCIEHWINRYGKYLSPSKIKKIINSGQTYNKAVLGVFLEFISGPNWFKSKFIILKDYVIPSQKKIKLFDHLPIPSKIDSTWEKYGIVAPLFLKELEVDKNLKTIDYVLQSIPELKFRIMGFPIAISDYKAFKKFEENCSLYKIAKQTHTPYSRLHKLHKDHLQYMS